MNGAPVPEIVDDLRKALAAKLVAYIAGVSETRTVREWAEATRRPTPPPWIGYASHTGLLCSTDASACIMIEVSTVVGAITVACVVAEAIA